MRCAPGTGRRLLDPDAPDDPRVQAAVHKRRSLVVDGFQAQWILTLVVWVAVLFVGFLVLLLGPVAWQVSRGEANVADAEAATALLTLHDRIWLPLIALLLALTLVIIKLTHRVAGPLYRFRTVFGEMARGNLAANAAIRANDYLHLESAALQDALRSVAARVGTARDAVAAIHAELDAADDAARAPDVARIRMAAAEAQAALAGFVTERPVTVPSPAPASVTVPHPEAGFSLVELLIAMTITVTLAALAMPAYEGALYRARVTKAVGDINALGKEITMYQASRNCFPASLADVQRGSLKDPWGRNYTYTVARAPGGGGGSGSCAACANSCVSAGQARKDKNLVPINADFDLYSLGKDGA